MNYCKMIIDQSRDVTLFTDKPVTDPSVDFAYVDDVRMIRCPVCAEYWPDGTRRRPLTGPWCVGWSISC